MGYALLDILGFLISDFQAMNADKMAMLASQIKSNFGPSVCSKIPTSIVHSSSLPIAQEFGWHSQSNKARELVWGEPPTTWTTDDVVVGLSSS